MHDIILEKLRSNPVAMETFLVQLTPPGSTVAMQRIRAQLQSWGAQVLFAIQGGQALIVHMDSQWRDPLQRFPHVALVGGVQIPARSVRRIRVDGEGNVVPTQY